ncbi:MAG TPA: nitroreductase, partial [Candidatus Limnocylindria bacterium]|nr:nitroreductase [Candidatus Limnocylindria bacterium]
AHAEGLHVHQMGGFAADAVRTSLALPETMTPYVVLAIGELGDPETLEEPFRSRETAPRTRLPLEEIAFAGSWGRPADLG